jgi:SAM-dependent methyltransferase
MMHTAPVDTVPEFFWDQFRDARLDRYLFRTEYEFVQQFLGAEMLAGPLLDLGCGSGKLGVPLSEQGAQVIGMDIDAMALQVFNRRTADAALVCGDAQRLPFATESAAHVIAVQSFMFGEPRLLLSEYHRVLRSGGVLIVQLLNRHGYKRALKQAFGRVVRLDRDRMDERFIDIPSCGEVLKLMGAEGFEILGTRGYNWLPFARDSDSMLVDVAAAFEYALGLHRVAAFSPWVLIAGRKR